MLPTSIGLYYPFINFRDENWLKIALLYWDRLSRIIPRSYENTDSEAVRRVGGELNAIIDSHPDDAPPEALRQFRELILQEAPALRKKYDVTHARGWKLNPTTLKRRVDRQADARFAYVFDEKLGNQVVPLLLDERLAIRGETRDTRWIGMHPELAAIFMTLLAEAIAKARGFRLLSDDVTRHISIGDFTAARLAHLALGRRSILGARSDEFEQAVALTAIRTVVPKNLEHVPIEAIVKFRKKYPNELRDFQLWIQKLAEGLQKQASNMALTDLRMHLEVVSEKEIEPRMSDLASQLKTVGIESATSVVNVKTVAGASLAALLAQPLIGAAWISFSAASQLAKHQREAKKLVSANPAAYLLLAKENLNPDRVLERISAAVRRFSLGV
jgi:hypothetical protein